MSAARVPCPLCAGRARLADAPCPRCEDGTVPACAVCSVEPVDPLFAPACSGDCREAWNTRQRLQQLRRRRASCGCPEEHATLEEWEAAHGEAFPASEVNARIAQ